MNTTKITESEISELKISSLPSRPTAPRAFGGRGYSARDMKAAFDMLPLFIIERFNSLLLDISDTGEGSLAATVPTGISEGHTLKALFSDITTGEACKYFTLADMTLAEAHERLTLWQQTVDAAIERLDAHLAEDFISGGTPAMRRESL